MFRGRKVKYIFLVTIILLFSLSISYGICSSKYNFNLAAVSDSWGEGGVGVKIFVESVRDLTGGDVAIETHLDGSWGGNEEDYLKSIQLGTLDMVNISLPILSQSIDNLMLWDIPFMFKGLIDNFYFTFESEKKHTPLTEKIIEQANEEANFVILAISPIGRRDIFASKPLNSLEDLKGLKIRTMASPIQVDTFNYMGAIATPLPYGECYTSIQLNLVDGMENSPTVYLRKRFFEVAPYWLGTSHYATSHVLVISEKAWNSLPNSYQNILKECAIGASYLQSTWSAGSYEILLTGEIEEVAEKMVYLTEEEHESLRGEVLPKLLDKYGKKISLDIIEVLAEQDEIVKSWYEKNK